MDEKPASSAEITSLLRTAKATDQEERAWDAAWRRWEATYEPLLKSRIMSGEGDADLRHSLAMCALRASDDVVLECLREFQNDPQKLLSFLFDLSQARRTSVKPKDRSNGYSALEALTPQQLEVIQAFDSYNEDAVSLGPYALHLFETAASMCRLDILESVTQVLLASGATPVDLIHRWLTEADTVDGAKDAAGAAVKVGDDELIAIALGHKRSHARRIALDHLVQRADEFPSELTTFASDPSGFVRLSVVDALGRSADRSHLSALIQLTADRWSTADHHFGEPPAYTVARKAAEALRHYHSLSDETCIDLVNSVLGSEDRVLARDVFITASACGSPTVRRYLWEVAMRKDLGWVRVDSLAALARSEIVEADILREAKVRFPKLPPPLAVECTELLTRHLPLEEAVGELEQIARSTARRCLLLVGVVTLNVRDAVKARKLLAFLGETHKASRLLDLNGKKLPASAIDDLGKVRLRGYVQKHLGGYFEMKP